MGIVSCDRFLPRRLRPLSQRGRPSNVSRTGLYLVLGAAIESFAPLAMQFVLSAFQAVGESRWGEEPESKSYRMGLAVVAMPTQIGKRLTEEIESTELSCQQSFREDAKT
jgi:hypothetical protein